MSSTNNTFHPLQIAVLTVSDTRNEETDTSGQTLVDACEAAGHSLSDRTLCKDDIYAVRAITSAWIADANTQVILITGGTGFAGRDSTPEAVQPLLDKPIVGFGELFRHISYQDIGTSTIQSRAFAGLANRTLIFCMPGSTGACKTAWEDIISAQIDSRTQPCNFYQQIRPL